MPEPIPSLIDQLGRDDRERLMGRSLDQGYERGDFIGFAGQPLRRVHIVRQGIVKLLIRNLAGDEAIVGVAAPGEMVGQMEAITGEALHLDAIAACRTVTTSIDAVELRRAIERTPHVALRVTKDLASRHRRLCDLLLERSTVDADGRLAGRLLEFGEVIGHTSEGYTQIDLPIPQADLGAISGMCRESACKVMTNFKRRGLIETNGTRVRLLRPDLLEKLRCGERVATPSRSEGAGAGPRTRSTRDT